jgi:hypothetical protein
VKLKLYQNCFLLLLAFTFSGCASYMALFTPLSPQQINSTLPTLTTSEFITRQEADEAEKNNKGKYLIKGRSYTAPLGLTTMDDLKSGARGIDEWVQLDGGNAYVLTNYKWVTIDGSGAAQLQLDFDTYLLN